MPTLGAPLDFVKLEGRNLVAHKLTTDPSSPAGGQIYYNTTTNTLMWYDSNLAAFVSARGGGAPAAHATSHQPGGSDPMAVDAAAGTGSLRTLGTASTNACAGNDSRLTDSRAPTGAAGGDLLGSTYPNPVVAALAITDAKVATANKDGANGTPCMRTLGRGAGQAMQGLFGLDTIAAGVGATGNITASSQRIINVADPSGAQDAATKNYVDTFSQGLDSHPSVRVATLLNVTTLAGGAPNVVDGITLVLGDRILVKDQTTTNQNGIYTVTTVGTGSNGTWARATDMDTWAEVPAAYVWVETGSANYDTGWTCTSDAGGTLGTTAITWVLFSSAAGAIAGSGLTKTGNTLDVGGTTNRISVAADSVDIDANYAGQATITTLGTVATGTWSATTIAVNKGGTGQTTAKAARETGLGAAGYYSTATHGAGTQIIIASGTHGLQGVRGLIVQCQVEATGDVIWPDINVSSAGTVTVTFSVSQSANTIRITILG